MQIQAHPRYRNLFSELRQSSERIVRPLEAPAYRCVELKWARLVYLISGEGTRRNGSRWMQPGYQRVVHAASTPGIALKESNRAFSYFGVDRPRQNPRVRVELNLALSRIIDLEKLMGFSEWLHLDELLGENWEKANQRGLETLSQACGRAVFESGFEGLVCPSAIDRRGRTIVWFPANLDSISRLEISGQSELERWLAK